jgi:putative membrane-bound dehydrogenase-like protein
MSRRFHAGAAATVCGVLLLAGLGARSPAADGKEPPTTNVLGDDKLLTLHLEIPAKEYEAMQPPPGGFGFGPPPAPQPARNRRDSERNFFGTEFPWAQCDLSSDGRTYKKVGIRYSGDITYFSSAQALKRPLKIEFSKFGEQQFHGLTSLQLHSMPMDPAKAREVLAFALFRAAGVPAPRAAFADVTLTVPGKYNKELLGVYAVVEGVDGTFLKTQVGAEGGLLMKPFQVRSVEYLGDDWQRYKGQYRPQSDATKEQSQRIIAFAKLVNQGKDDEFKKEIGSYLDVDGFLRFLAANALTTNLESAFALGHNYHLYLHPKTNKFAFFPSDLEFSLANFMLFGSADELMDLSLTHPYPGDNKLVDRLLGIKEVNARYREILKELSEKVFSKQQIIKQVEAIEKATKASLAKEKKAVEARRETQGGFAPPGGGAPQAPDLKTFADKRTASIASQLAGKSKGYTPRALNFGPPPGGGGFGPPGGGVNQAIDERIFRTTVRPPEGFEATLYAAPPRVNYPVALAAAPNGDLFVAVDEQGSIGRTPGGGKVLRCVDRDGDGKVDEVTTFAKMDHPRGLIYQDGKLWVLHSSFLSVYEDTGKGVAGKSEVLVTGLTSDMVNQRGGDHATNGIRMGLDGWIYIAVGDYGCPPAKGKDGSTVTMRGGIVRVRPDGTDLEIFATGLRNPFDIGIDPFMNLFTRDNDDNRAGGWDIRVMHLMQSAYYGYSQHYANFPDEIMPPLGQFGGGSGTGTLYLQDMRWPEKYRNVLFTGDWGRSEVYRHELTKSGPTFALSQEVFLSFPRPTGMDMDSSGRLYIASWRGGEASTYVGPNVGFIARLTPKGLKAEKATSLKDAKFDEVSRQLSGPNTVARLLAQREILRRGRSTETTEALGKLATDAAAPLEGRVAAILALKQLDGKDSHPLLLKLLDDTTVREFAMRALTDRKKELAGLDSKPFIAALSDPSARVRAQALISLGRLNDVSTAKSIIPLTSRPKAYEMPTRKPVHAQPDPDRALPHLAVRTLVSLHASDACVEAIDGPHAHGALWALRYMHDKKAVEGLIGKLGTIRSADLRREVLATLIRLYYREADYKGVWWGIRPENTGPYYDAVEWDQTKRIGTVLTSAVLDADSTTAEFLRGELARHRVELSGLPSNTTVGKTPDKETPIVIEKPDPKNPNQIGNMAYEAAVRRVLAAKGNAAQGKKLFTAHSCIACHTDADGQTLKGPHMVDIGKRYSAAELAESILKPSEKIAQGFETYIFEMADGKVFTGFIVSESAKSVLIRESTSVPRELKKAQIESRVIQKQSLMPDGLVSAQTPEGLADLIAYLQSLNGNGEAPKPQAPDKKDEKNKQPDPPSAPYDDYKNMLDQLGIKKMRPGRNGQGRDTSDEATANPYKDSLPDLMTFKDGSKVKTADQWPKRRAEIIELFEREVYGRIPKDVPKVKWEVTRTTEGESGGIKTVTKTLVGHVDNSAFPQIKVDIQANFTVPKDRAGKVPIIMQFGGGFGFGGGRPGGAKPWTQQAIEKTWGHGTINPNSVQGDNNRLREGIIGLTNKGKPRSPEDWGALRAWAWGVSRLIDYFEDNPDSGVDPKKVCITGVSRYGKAALVTAAFEPRIAAGFVASSGAGGAKLHRHIFGEMLENVAGSREYHWMAGNYLKYGADEATSGKKTAADLPVDQHQLIALCAPRLCFISNGIPPGDPNWIDARGSFMSTVLAGPAYRLLGKKDLGTPGDYLTDKMPAVNTLIGGELAWRQHDGGHTNIPNFPAFYEWAGHYISSPGLMKKE